MKFKIIFNDGSYAILDKVINFYFNKSEKRAEVLFEGGIEWSYYYIEQVIELQST